MDLCERRLLTPTIMGGVPREQKKLERHLPGFMYHQVYKYKKTITAILGKRPLLIPTHLITAYEREREREKEGEGWRERERHREREREKERGLPVQAQPSRQGLYVVRAHHERHFAGVSRPHSWRRYPVFEDGYRQNLTNLL